ncbi:MAG: insulinase family protein [Bacteroides sp.]|nr:insulinase family protein [Bacteroides sp.]MCM1413307.1 insulinase family protein [Bacteroides sp.]MCM1471383.1 insulinase family protein [Bacteroides sp.]
MKPFRLLLTLLLFTPLAAAAKYNPLPVDPDLRKGTLPNGLTYYIRHNNTPENRADFFIAMKVGSINEEENQRGLAHFLEHMCFNGTKHFPGNSLISYLESIGVKFGANLNAYTSTDETVYNICNVPTTRTTSVDSCLLILRDWSHDLTLDGADIDAERGVIKGEWRQRNGTAANRMLERAAPVIYGESLYGRRLPIGLMEIVENFPHQDLRDYYRRWYYPENQCIVVVGDIDPDYIEASIRNMWADVNRPDFDVTSRRVEVPDNKSVIATVQSDPEQVTPMVQIHIKHATLADSAVNTIAELRNDLARYLVTDMLAERLTDLETATGSLMSNVGIGDRAFLLSHSCDALMVRAATSLGRETECVAALATELQRAAKFGFTDIELRRAQLNYRSELDKRFARRDKRTNTEFARIYCRNYLDGGALPSEEQYYRMMLGVINQVGLEQVNAWIRDIVRPDNSNVVLLAYVPGSDNLPLNDQTLAEAYTVVDYAALTPYEAHVVDTPLLTSEPSAGKVVSEQADTLFGSTVWTLSNGIRVHLLPTTYSPDQVIIAGYSPGGFSAGYDPALSPEYHLANDALAISKFGGHTQTDLRRILAGKSVRTSITIDNMEERLSAVAAKADIADAFRLLYLKATAAGKDEVAFKAMVDNHKLKLTSQGNNPTFTMADSIHYHVYSKHPLGKKLSEADVDSVNYDRIMQLYADRFGDMTDFDFYILGDFAIDSIRPLVETYLASLPAAGRRESPSDIGYRYTSGRDRMRFTTPMQTPQTIAYTFYNSDCDYNLRNVICGHAIGSLIQSALLKDLREDRGWTYSIKGHGGVGAGMNGSDSPKFIMPVYIKVSPENADSTFDIVAATVDSYADPATIADDELLKIKQYMIKSYDQNKNDNSYWLTVLHVYDKFGRDMHNGYTDIVESLTPADIAEFARNYIVNANRIQLEMSPAD